MRDRNEWFKEAKGALRHLEIEAVENPFAWPTVACVADGEDVLHALGLHPSRDVGGIVNVDESEVLELAELISPEPVTGSTHEDKDGKCKLVGFADACTLTMTGDIWSRVERLCKGDGEKDGSEK